MQQSLQHTFSHLLQEVGADENQAAKAWQELSTLYQEPGRYYHTLRHIDHMLREMETQLPDSLQSVELQLSIWYHDVVYDPKSKENELRSAEICKEVLHKISNLSEERINRIYTNILSTKGHQVLATGVHVVENEFMLDIDLSILGASKEKYHGYSEDIRKEYIHIPLPDYKLGRSQVLQSFLQREEIYFSDLFKKLYEEKARKNLEWEIQSLEK